MLKLSKGLLGIARHRQAGTAPPLAIIPLQGHANELFCIFAHFKGVIFSSSGCQVFQVFLSLVFGKEATGSKSKAGRERLSGHTASRIQGEVVSTPGFRKLSEGFESPGVALRGASPQHPSN